MKTIRRLYKISLTSALAFTLSILLSIGFMMMILDLKELSLQTWKVRTAWNELSAVTEDIMFLRLDSIHQLSVLKSKWMRKIERLDRSFKALSKDPNLSMLPDHLNEELLHAAYIWRFSRKRVTKAQQILEELSDESKLLNVILANGAPSLSENIQDLSRSPQLRYGEKSIYRSFTANMAVFDMTRNEFTDILHRINNEIPPILEKRVIWLVIWSLFMLIITVLYTLVALTKTARPISKLASTMKNIGSMDYRDLRPPSDLDNIDDEIVIIERGVYEMSSRLSSLHKQNLEIERDRQEAKLRALQYQINPHFIYNTLGSIQLAASLEANKRLAEAIKSLSCLIRKTIKGPGDLIPLSDEMAMIGDYIDIMQFRYNDGLKVRNTIPQELLPLLIPGRMLQPILENAIQHGLSEKLNSGDQDARITISGELGSEDLTIKLADNGIGMREDTVNSLLTQGKEELGAHIGVNNIHQRLQLRFGKAYGLKIKSSGGRGTEVSLKLPILRSLSDDQRFSS